VRYGEVGHGMVSQVRTARLGKTWLDKAMQVWSGVVRLGSTRLGFAGTVGTEWRVENRRCVVRRCRQGELMCDMPRTDRARSGRN